MYDMYVWFVWYIYILQPRWWSGNGLTSPISAETTRTEPWRKQRKSGNISTSHSASNRGFTKAHRCTLPNLLCTFLESSKPCFPWQALLDPGRTSVPTGWDNWIALQRPAARDPTKPDFWSEPEPMAGRLVVFTNKPSHWRLLPSSHRDARKP